MLQRFEFSDGFLTYVQNHSDELDCLLFISSSYNLKDLQGLTWQLCEWGLLLPTVLVIIEDDDIPDEYVDQIQALRNHERFFYHNATLVKPFQAQELLEATQELSDSILATQVDRAIALFLQLSPTCGLPEGETNAQTLTSISERVHLQQQRLAEKLRERLGYTGVYYHRDPERFYRRLSTDEQHRMMHRLRGLYQAIVLEYFQSSRTANARIDEFVALAFFGDIGASQVLELHMNLMDDFAKQLKLEGRSEEVLLDYRITLIDVIAHLSEMYRRSIPR